MMEHNAAIQGDKPHNLSWTSTCWWNRMPRIGRQSPEPYPEPGNEDWKKCHKTRETIPEPHPKPKGLRKWWWNRMPEYPKPKNHGETKLFLEKIENPIQLQSCLGNKPRNPGRNQDMMMEQSARRVGRQAPEPQPEPRKDDGTGCQKSRETSLGTLAGTRKREQDSNPEPQPEPGKDDGTGCQKSRETSLGTLAGTRKWWWNTMPKEKGGQAPEP